MTERDDLIGALARHRGFLLFTAQGLTEQQARTTSTVSALTIAGILKHVADTEEQWLRFALHGAEAFGPWGAPGDDTAGDATSAADWSDSQWVDERFLVSDADTLERLRGRVAEVAAATERILREADLDAAHQLPRAPWFEPGVSWSVRRVALHVIAEVSQHAGHADIIRESIDGQRTMG